MRAAALVALLLVALAPSALAHASLESSRPTAGGAVERSPDRVELVFSEVLDPSFSSVKVENDDGLQLDKGDVAYDGSRASVGIPTLPKGVYWVHWQALSQADGHTTRGTFPFVVGDAALLAGLDASATQDVATGGPAEAVARAIGFAGLALAVGAPVFAFVVAPKLVFGPAALDAARRTVRGATVLGGVLVAGASVALFAFAMERNLATDVVAFATGTRVGALLAARFGAGVLVAALAAAPRLQPVAPLAPAALAALTVSAGAHAAALSPVHVVADLLHVLAVSTWLGGLAVLVVLAWRTPTPARALVAAFTPTASVSVAVLVLSGTLVLLALLDLRELVTTSYGLTMTRKLVLVVLMLALGATNAFVLGPRARAGRPGVDAWFRRTVAAEFAFGLVVLALAGLLTNSSPPAYAVEVDAGPPLVRLEGRANDLGLELLVGPAPLSPGIHRFDVRIVDPPGGDHDVTNVTLEFSYPADRSLGEVAVPLEAVSHGEQYGTQGAYLAREGEWRVEIKVRRSDAYDARAVFALVVGGNP